ncbi:hypothetical protein PG999_001577 [Apiospora kogelbergensis]|uniref:Uncharacterized protein n=1 Tax=Apiospora kogelbergensis TaxID=1337665 RepID=A0AAW0R5M7_9PEZI
MSEKSSGRGHNGRESGWARGALSILSWNIGVSQFVEAGSDLCNLGIEPSLELGDWCNGLVLEARSSRFKFELNIRAALDLKHSGIGYLSY